MYGYVHWKTDTFRQQVLMLKKENSTAIILYGMPFETTPNSTECFSLDMPSNIRLQVEQDLALRNFEKRKILALIVSLMQRTNIRIGSNIYEKLYGSFGLTTLKNKHVEIKGQKITFSFKGKKGVMHHVDLKSKRLARLVQKCKEIPGKELFQYLDEEGIRHSIDSGMVNDYIKEISGEDFTAKDFRTWSGTVGALIAFKEIGYAENDTQYKKKVKEALDIVAEHLGNTTAVCRKYYVHPLVINLYENNTIKKYLDELDVIEENDGKADLTKEEKLVIKILENEKFRELEWKLEVLPF
jgi:DNA topoisomerase-1